MGEIIRLLVHGPRILYIAAVDGRYGSAMAVGDGGEGLHAQQRHLVINKQLADFFVGKALKKPQIYHSTLVLRQAGVSSSEQASV